MFFLKPKMRKKIKGDPLKNKTVYDTCSCIEQKSLQPQVFPFSDEIT